MGVLEAIAEAGLSVPDDISVAGYDNTTFAAFGPISLTSVDQAGRQIGANAARLLLDRIADRQPAVGPGQALPHPGRPPQHRSTLDRRHGHDRGDRTRGRAIPPLDKTAIQFRPPKGHPVDDARPQEFARHS